MAHILAQVHVHFAFISRSFATLRKVQNSTMVEIQFNEIIIVSHEIKIVELQFNFFNEFYVKKLPLFYS